MRLLVDDWREQLAAEQKRRSAELMQAALGSDWGTVDTYVAACNEMQAVATLVVALADRLGLSHEGRAMGMAADIKERCEGERLLRAVQRALGLTPSGVLAEEFAAARRALEERPTFGRLDEDEQNRGE